MVGGEDPSTLLRFCLYYQVNIIAVECSHTDSLVRSSKTAAVCSSFVLLCTTITTIITITTINTFTTIIAKGKIILDKNLNLNKIFRLISYL